MIGFFLIPVYTYYLTPSDYGIISVASVIASVLAIIFIFGQNGSLSRFYYGVRDSEEEFRDYLSTIIIFIFVTTLGITIFLSVFGNLFFPLIVKDLPFNPYILLVLWTTFFSTPLLIYLTLCQVREKAFFYSIINIIQFLLTTSLIIYFVVFLREGALGNLLAQFIVAIVFLAVTLFLIRKEMKFTFDTSSLKSSLAFGIPLIPHSLAGWLIALVDRLILNNFYGLAIVGIYSLGYQFANIVGFAASAINFAWVPFFMSAATERGEAAKKDFSIITTYFVLLLFFIALGISILSKDVINFLTPVSYHEAVIVIPVIVAAFVFSGLYYMVANQLFFVKKTNILPFITGAAAVIIIIANFILIPPFGMIGAAFATLIAYLFIFCVTFYFSHKYYPISYEYQRIFKIVGISVFIFVLCTVINLDKVLFDFAVKLVLIVLVYISGLIILGFFSRQEKDIIRITARKYLGKIL